MAQGAANALQASKAQSKKSKSPSALLNAAFSYVPGLASLLDLKEREVNKDPRHLYHNVPIPADELDSKTGLPKAKYSSNKIRTTKYTPLNFIPKNLYLQFMNVANIYFLAVAILAAFSIFGVGNAGLGAVPIIAIVVVTAIRDAIEDYRRQLLDREMNNEITTVLVGADNKNVVLGNVGPWRAFKKACSHFYSRVWHMLIGKKKSNRNLDLEPVSSTPRPSMATGRPSTQRGSGDWRSSLDFRRSMDRRSFRPSTETHRTGLGHGLGLGHGHGPPPVKFKREYWKNIVVGQFIKIFENESVPADVAVISSSDPDGEVFIETRNLDGETNLKPRQAILGTHRLRHSRDVANAEFWLEVENANSNLESFGWTIHINGKDESLTPANFLPRGSTVRNTRWVIGYVVYTGFESKIMLNAGETPTKRSRLTRDLNFYTFISFALLFLLSFVSGLVEGLKFRSKHSSAYFFEKSSLTRNPPLSGFVNFWAAMILLQNLIPISLYISIEIVRTIQAFFIWSDIQMYDEFLDYPCTPKTWSISDDLGQVEFIFSDKTGTLTQNSMVFRKAVVGNKSYGIAFTEAMAGNFKRQGGDADAERERMAQEIASERRRMIDEMHKTFKNPFAHGSEFELVSEPIIADLAGASGAAQQQRLNQFGLVLALCNNVTTSESKDGTLQYKSQSPDEAALVTTARDLGFVLTTVGKGYSIVDNRGTMERFEVLQALMFTSARKRMSVLVKAPDGKCYVLSKGADNVITKRLRAPPDPETVEILTDYANEGLRTLMVAYREVSEKFATDWVQRYSAAVASPDRETLMEQVGDELECQLTLVGGTGIEDLLQVGVPDTIQQLGQAGIKLWVLTGDKIETAISIGFSCNLLDNDMELMIATKPDDLQRYLKELGLTVSDEAIKQAAANHRPPPATHALIIDGDTLDVVVGDAALSREFALLGKQCKSVLCCRVSPSQKAAVVHIIKTIFDVTTLAIGDGANDVAMIQEADVGVGIVGVEGRQAAMSSDYAFGQFRFLQRLVLVHGRWSYNRIAEMTANLLYKNFVFTMVLFWYGIFTDMDQSYLFDYTYLTLFNSVFTSLPVVFMGCLDQDVPDYVCLAVPQLYAKGILRRAFTRAKFFAYATDGIYQSAVCFFFAFCVFFNGRMPSFSGQDNNYREAMGVYAATAAVTACNAFVLINQRRWDWLSLACVIISSFLIFAWTGIYTSFPTSGQFYKSAVICYGNLSFWAVSLLSLILALLPRIMYLAIQQVWYPDDVDIVREEMSQGQFKQAKEKCLALSRTIASAPIGEPEPEKEVVLESDSGNLPI